MVQIGSGYCMNTAVFGAGFVYAFSERVFTRLEWQRPVKDTSKVSLSLSLIYNF
jgi:hypothetical protein